MKRKNFNNFAEGTQTLYKTKIIFIILKSSLYRKSEWFTLKNEELDQKRMPSTSSSQKRNYINLNLSKV